VFIDRCVSSSLLLVASIGTPSFIKAMSVQTMTPASRESSSRPFEATAQIYQDPFEVQ
jgi:hypothetical protein